MSLPIYQRVAVTDAGDVIPGAEYTVINENTGVAAPIYSDRTGATLLTAPYFADSAGTIQFFIAQGTTFRVAASGGVGTYTDRYVYGVAEAVLVDASGNANIAGTVTADGLTVAQNTGSKLTLSSTNVSIAGSDIIGEIDFLSADGSGIGAASRANISVVAADAAGAGDVYIKTSTGGSAVASRQKIANNGDISFYEDTGTTPKFYWDASAENLGIGTSTPTLTGFGSGTSGLEIADSNKAGIRLNGGAADSLYFISGAAKHWIYGKGAVPLTFSTNAVERMRLDSSGNLLVGTTSSPAAFASNGHAFVGVSGTSGVAPVAAYNSQGTANCPVFNVLSRDASTDSSNRFMQFYSNVTLSTGTAMGGIVGNGTSNVQFAALSDVREKQNITSLAGSLSKINRLNPVEFDWIASGEHCEGGFVAQEVEEIFPEYVIQNVSNGDDEERKGITGGMTAGFVSHLVKAIQEQQTLIEALTARIEALEG